MKLFSIIWLCLVLMMFSCKTKKVVTPPARPGAGAIRSEGYIVKTSVLNQTIEVPGSLLAYEETEIHPEVAGKIVILNIRDGIFVGKGALLAKLFDGDLQAQLRKLKVQLQIAQKTEERSNELLKINAISQQEHDLNILQVSNIRADIAIIQANIAKTEIRAPFSGKVGFKNISNGSYVTPATIVSTISQVSQLKLQFEIPEKYYTKVANGQLVSFSVEGVPKRYAARVIATEAGITEDTRSLKVLAVVQATDRFITPGSFAKVQFNMGDNDQAIMVPSQAILSQARAKKVIVYRSGTPSFQTVTTGVRDSAMVQILSGLAVGDTIVTTGLLAIRPTSKIQLSAVKK